MYYIMHSLSRNPGAGDGTLAGLLRMGNVVIGLFSVLFLFYTNSFLMKRRKREFGLFNILGMDRGNIGKILAWETAYVYVIGLGLGLGFGILLSKLVDLMLSNMLRFDIRFTFEISTPSILSTLLLFTAIFLLLLFHSLRQIHGVNPIELLRGGEVGEKEPKSKVVLTILGAACLIAGYAMALFIEEPLAVIMLFFVEVILVILGTYLLFTVGSIVLLKLMRRNKGYYYKPKHFISVSGMMYRMKQNAAGLATICILSTMVLVMLSSTASLYFGIEDSLAHRYPYEIHISAKQDSEELRDFIEEENQRILQEQRLEQGETLAYRFLPVAVERSGGNFALRNEGWDGLNSSVLNFIPLEDFRQFASYDGSLEANEVLVYSQGRVYDGEELTLGGITFQVREKGAADFPVISLTEAYNSDTSPVYYVILPDDQAMEAILAMEPRANNGERLNLRYQMSYNMAGEKGNGEEKGILAVSDALKDSLYANDLFQGNVESRTANRGEFYQLYGGLFFLGIFLGIVFVMATVLIIYYKQVSEGYDDQKRFAIMKKVGLSEREAKRAVDSQISSMFFIPLAVAVLHLVVAFPALGRMLALINQTNTALFAVTTLAAVVLFAIAYALVYKRTAKVYLNIVKQKQ